MPWRGTRRRSAEVVRRAEAAGRREEADHLVAPRSRKRMLHHRQQLDVRVAHLLDVRDRGARRARGRSGSDCPPRARAPTSRGAPRRRDIGRSNHDVLRARALHPLLVAPLVVAARVTMDAVSGGTSNAEPEGIGLEQHLAVSRPDLELVAVRRRATPGTKISQTPLTPSDRIGCARPSQPLKSPTTLTRCALGAQTAKCTPAAPPIVIGCAPSLS